MDKEDTNAVMNRQSVKRSLMEKRIKLVELLLNDSLNVDEDELEEEEDIVFYFNTPQISITPNGLQLNDDLSDDEDFEDLD